MMHPIHEATQLATRRSFFGRTATGLGAMAVQSLLGSEGFPNFAPKAKRVIYLFQHGGPSQLDLFDYKPGLAKLRGTELPDSIRQGQRLTGMTAFQTGFPTAPSVFQFARHGQSGAHLSELLPHTAKVVDELAIVRSVHTEAINHDPGGDVLPDGFQLGRTAQYRGMDQLWAGQRESGTGRPLW